MKGVVIMGNPWEMADKVAEYVESHEHGEGKYWGATSQGDGQIVNLEAHDGTTMDVSYTDNGDGSWTLGNATVTRP